MPYVTELPDENGLISRPPRAVLEVRSEMKNGHEKLIPINPLPHAARWLEGWHRHFPAVWVEVPGPARILSAQEHHDLIASIPAAVKDVARGRQGKTQLKTRRVVTSAHVSAIKLTLYTLLNEQPGFYYDLEQVIYNQEYRLFDTSRQALMRRKLVDRVDKNGHAVIPELVMRIVLTANGGKPITSAR